jgi:hypothetical protein
MRHKILLLIILLAGLLQSCRNDIPYLSDPHNDAKFQNWTQVFNSYWESMNNNYAFWSVDSTDWDAMYDKYAPRFEALGTIAEEDDEEGKNAVRDSARSYFKEMSAGLIDHHFFATLKIPSTYYIMPGDNEVMNRKYYHWSNTDFRFNVLHQYKELGRLTSYTEPSVKSSRAYSGVLDGDIVYLGLTEFALTGSERTEVIDALKNYNMLLDTLQNIKGVIIDVRENGGGNCADLDSILGKFVDSNYIFAYQRTKDGPGRLDYTPWVPATIHPMKRARKLDIPIVALADVNSVSMAEITTMAIRTFPKGCSVGERTFGGHGALLSTNIGFETTNCGRVINDAWDIYCCNYMTKTLDGQILEGIGITPTYEVFWDLSSLDTQLERAIQVIHTGK